MTCKPGDLVLIPYTYSDLSASRKRPVLALTSPDRHGDFIALAVTSIPQGRQAIRLDRATLTQDSVPKTSWIRLDKVFTLSERIIVKKFGQVKADILRDALDGLCRIVGFLPHE